MLSHLKSGQSPTNSASCHTITDVKTGIFTSLLLEVVLNGLRCAAVRDLAVRPLVRRPQVPQVAHARPLLVVLLGRQAVIQLQHLLAQGSRHPPALPSRVDLNLIKNSRCALLLLLHRGHLEGEAGGRRDGVCEDRQVPIEHLRPSPISLSAAGMRSEVRGCLLGRHRMPQAVVDLTIDGADTK